MEDSTVYSDNPVKTATRWVEEGTKRLHLVDLDGAFSGKPENREAIQQILKAHPGLPVQLGGGIRDIKTIEFYLDFGIRWIIIGTAAVKNPSFVTQACRLFPGQIIVGIDAEDGMVATDGWAEATTIPALELVKQFAGDGVASIVYTDIGRDGMLSGVNIQATVALARSTDCPVIASGGLKDLSDVMALLSVADEGILGVITGKAIYEGKLILKEAITLTERQ